MKISFKIAESNSQLERAILNALLPDTIEYMNKASVFIKNNLYPLLKSAILSQPEYESLVNGQLRLELGIPDASSRVQDLIDIWISNAVVEYKKPSIVNNKIKSSLSIKMIKVDFSDVVNLRLAHIDRATIGATIPWLEWLLLEGTATLVDNYEVFIGPNNRSRTGSAIMKASEGDSWSIPSEFAGTIGDNWITRAIDSMKDNVQELLKKALSQ